MDRSEPPAGGRNGEFVTLAVFDSTGWRTVA